MQTLDKVCRSARRKGIGSAVETSWFSSFVSQRLSPVVARRRLTRFVILDTRVEFGSHFDFPNRVQLRDIETAKKFLNQPKPAWLRQSHGAGHNIVAIYHGWILILNVEFIVVDTTAAPKQPGRMH